MTVTATHTRAVTVANPQGLHLRPASLFSQAARKFSCSVTVWNGPDRKANGKEMLELVLLVALPGAELVLEADGADAASALEVLSTLLADPGDGA